MKLFPYLVLMRPANIITAISDVIAGAAICGFLILADHTADWLKLMFLVLSTIGLYGGGIVFNDVCDLELDKVERPERPIPSGQVTKNQALNLALSLYTFGIALAFLCSPTSGIIAIAIAICASLYDKYGKHHGLLGPLNMG
ncbi:MAG: UbiA family prenyltransferase, partial [Cyclobacteriaceae bacterium]|nr:UbiA family prenyltransferase [Cyclobacteriaceae bacterium]